MCYSTNQSALLEGLLAPVHLIVCVIVSTLYCAVPYIAACVDVSGTVLSGPFTCIQVVAMNNVRNQPFLFFNIFSFLDFSFKTSGYSSNGKFS